MTRRSLHGLHVVRDGDTRPAQETPPVLPDPGERPFIRLHQQYVGLAIAGTLNADTAGRLRMFLAMFTIAGGPGELVLDLSDVVAVDEDGMAPIVEAENAMRLRRASLQLASVSTAVTDYFDDVRVDRPPATGSPPEGASPEPAGGLAVQPPDDDRPRRGQV